MTDTEPAPADVGDEASGQPGQLDQPGLPDDAREAAMIRKVLRIQERHREGGVDPELAGDDDDPGPRASG